MTRAEIRKQQIFNYLDWLRETGITNMFGAAPYIKEEFETDIQEARKLLGEWMEHKRSENK